MLRENTKYEILTPNGFENFDGIQQLYKDTIKITCTDIECIVSNNHVFVVDGKDLSVGDLSVGDFIQHKTRGIITITDICDNNKINVYDPINVDNNIYYANDIIHHNCEFLGSANTVIDKETLVMLINKDLPDPIGYASNDRVRIFEKPLPGMNYILGCDPSKGTGEHDATIQVLKITSVVPFRVEQVCVFQDNKTDTHDFAYIIHNLSVQYNNAFIMVENNGEGSAVIQTLWWEIETENLVCEGTKVSKLGVRATTKTKPISVLLMKKLIEDGSLELIDHDTIKQLTAFIDKGNNRFVGDGLPDDLVSALYWGTYFMKFDLLDETMQFKKNDDDDDWSIFTDSDDIEDGYEVLYK